MFNDAFDFLKENFGKILIVLGPILLFPGLLLLSTFGCFLSALCIFFGIMLTALGFFIQLELFSDFRSLDCWGSVLLFASIVFFALSIALFQFLEVTSFTVIQEVFKGALLPYKRVVLHTERPYLWLCGLLLWAGFFSFAAGLVVKVVRSLGFV